MDLHGVHGIHGFPWISMGSMDSTDYPFVEGFPFVGLGCPRDSGDNGDDNNNCGGGENGGDNDALGSTDAQRGFAGSKSSPLLMPKRPPHIPMCPPAFNAQPPPHPPLASDPHRIALVDMLDVGTGFLILDAQAVGGVRISIE